MKKTFTYLFYIIAFGAVSYFLRVYLNAPKSFIISLIISLAIILLMIAKKSRYTKGVGMTLIIIHAIWLIGYFIPVYDRLPDIRQRYRRNPTLLMTVPSSHTGVVVTFTHGKSTFTAPAANFQSGVPIYQGDRIETAGQSFSSDDRMMIAFWDGSTVQMFPQSRITLKTHSPDFANLSGSRINILLEGGIISAHTRRSNFTPRNRAVKAGDISFSCRDCIIALSGSRGSIVSSGVFSWSIDSGELIILSGGAYTFTNSSVSAISNPAISNNPLAQLFANTTAADATQSRQYDSLRTAFASEQRGWSMDKSILLSELSKVKMAIVGLFDWTYRQRYDELMLYEYIKGNSDTIPPRFEGQKYLYEFIH